MDGEIYKKIGEVVIKFTGMESWLATCFNTTSFYPNKLTSNGFTYLIKKNLYKLIQKVKNDVGNSKLDDEIKAFFLESLNEADKIREERNNLLHSKYVLISDSKDIRVKDDSEGWFEEIPKEDFQKRLNTLCENIEACSWKLMMVLTEKRTLEAFR